MTATFTPAQFREELGRFTGSQVFYRHPLNRRVVYTEGVQFLAEAAGAYWLVDAIASYFGTDLMRAVIEADRRIANFQVWSLEVVESRAVLTMTADAGVPTAISQPIGFTDFPLERVDIWAGFDGETWTLYLPSEH